MTIDAQLVTAIGVLASGLIQSAAPEVAIKAWSGMLEKKGDEQRNAKPHRCL
jgi:hypothetical protein